MKIRILFILFGFFTVSNISAQLRFARLFSDHAVLQRSKPIPVWGWASANEAVQVTLQGPSTQKRQAVADASGKWMVQFDALESGGSYTLHAATATAKADLTDLLIGDVWLCSGQSNMEWTVRQADNYLKERKNAEFPKIRHFRVDHEVALSPQQDLNKGEWEICNAETVGGFTAVGFFFAREVFQETGVPIGLLHSSWGGSQVEGWISKEAMIASEVLNGYGQNLPLNWEEADLRLERSIKKRLLGNADANPTVEDEQRYFHPDYDYAGWLTADPMWQWDWKGVWAWRGNGYMAKTIEIPAEMTSQITTLGLADNFNRNDVYINGKLVASGLFKGNTRILIPANTWKPGQNKLVVKINRRVEPEWYGVGLMGSDKDLFVSTETQSVSLAGNDWRLMPAFADQHEYAHSSNNVGTAIYNAMIAPLIPYGICGALWYQGESNAGRAYEYRHSFPLMIKDWRARWKEDFPFYFVQLSSYGPFQNSNEGSEWAELREAQTLTLQLPNTGMAVTTDIGNPTDVHPTNKQDVGKRLAANALKQVYKKEVLFSGPVFEKAKFEKTKAVLTFGSTGSGLIAKDKYGYLKGFEIAGADRVFYYAPARIVGKTVVLDHPKGLKPVSVRYAWANSPEDANLFNAEGFPAVPFRTDEWEGLTVKRKFE